MISRVTLPVSGARISLEISAVTNCPTPKILLPFKETSARQQQQYSTFNTPWKETTNSLESSPLYKHCFRDTVAILRTAMTTDFTSLTLIWLLPLAASNAVTSNQTEVFSSVVTVESFSHNELTTHRMPQTYPEKITATKDAQRRSQTMPSNMILPNTKTTPAPTSSASPHLNRTPMESLTEIQSTAIKSSMTVQTGTPATPTSVTPVIINSTQSQKALSTHVRRHTNPYPPTFSPKSTKLISTTNTITTPEEDKSESMSPAAGDDVKHSTGLHKTSTSIHNTRKTKIQEPSERKKTNHGKVVAGLIGGALLVMMVGFLIIFIKKRKLQKQQVSTTDWAGPSPFLEGGANNGQVTMRPPNRISVASFLPARLSKRLSLLPETDEELEDMTQVTTFGDKNQGTTFGRTVNGNDGPESNGTNAVFPEMRNTVDIVETAENCVSAESSQTNNPVSTNNSILRQDLSANQSNLSEVMENMSEQMNNALMET
ncbi:protein EVI2B [Oreochromis aureus]|nr:protein EVI2B [Oreochromis aureus]